MSYSFPSYSSYQTTPTSPRHMGNNGVFSEESILFAGSVGRRSQFPRAGGIYATPAPDSFSRCSNLAARVDDHLVARMSRRHIDLPLVDEDFDFAVGKEDDAPQYITFPQVGSISHLPPLDEGMGLMSNFELAQDDMVSAASTPTTPRFRAYTPAVTPRSPRTPTFPTSPRLDGLFKAIGRGAASWGEYRSSRVF